MFCPECGTDHHSADRIIEAAADREVVLAKIDANKTIEVERIRAGVARELAETENALKTEHAEGVTEGMETALAATAGGGQAEELGEPGAPIVVESAAPEEPEPIAPDMAPPEIVDPSPGPSSGGDGGWWSGYGR